MKKNNIRFFAILIIIALLISTFSFQVFAKPDNIHRDSLEKAVYLTNDKEAAKISKSTGIQTNAKDQIVTKAVVDSEVVIVDFEDLLNDPIFSAEVAKQIRCGKVFYIRAEGYSANRSIIAKTLGIAESAGKIREATDKDIYARKGSFGYIVYVDGKGSLQVVRQLVAYADMTKYDEDIVPDLPVQVTQDAFADGEINNEMIEVYENAPEFTFSDEMDAIDSFLDMHSATDVGTVTEVADVDLSVQASFKSYAYEILYDTTYWYGYVRTSSSSVTSYKKIGAITRAMYAERLYCATANWSNPSYLTSKWAYMSDIYMQPTWNQSKSYRSLNRNIFVSYSTWPTGSGNATYKMVLRDYIPKVDLSGKTDVTISVGANATASGKPGLSGNAGFSASTSYSDVKIEVPKWQVGLSQSQNIAQLKFTMGGAFDRFSGKAVLTSTIALTSGVVLWNYANKYSCIQLNYSAYWNINNGVTNSNDKLINGSGAVVWQPAKLY